VIALLVALIVVPGAAGDLLNSAGMKQIGEITDWSGHGILRLCRKLLHNYYILASLPAMAISFFAMMALLSVSNLSFAVPVTASSFILETALAKYWLGEQVDWRRWLGTILVAVGIVLISI
jgi:drug/metabolite transporter (DMT)-like permease